MQIRTAMDIGLLIRESRRRRSMTGPQLACQPGGAHSWLSEIENGKPTAVVSWGIALNFLIYGSGAQVKNYSLLFAPGSASGEAE